MLSPPPTDGVAVVVIVVRRRRPSGVVSDVHHPPPLDVGGADSRWWVGGPLQQNSGADGREAHKQESRRYRTIDGVLSKT